MRVPAIVLQDILCVGIKKHNKEGIKRNLEHFNVCEKLRD